ncbi:4Fe-4S binding protein [Caldisalinibacter kiritimatiensis]|uniref:4Fe-4S ferredoxin, iron-sulfur binding domain protein n=1 Tax=Caldisalinibacter kiritimatiensis TaxID=1304284 RepID=R1AX10_9FIRM|nr:4Fe-4S binding protein [Caldisalinibacter kiritimatiensis]EOD01743.1 4Fe-4S ferredoxin, iron-sulfur binding domain protein [Caldisalinibacter kiritimatiensis]
MLSKTGVADKKLVKEKFPSLDRLKKGPIAIIECFERIPCNPCSTVCKRGAIKEMKDINDIPVIDPELCNGCGLCISCCPGLAIMVIDATYADDKVIFKIPYEFLPVPKIGDKVKGLDRSGKYITDVKIVNVLKAERQDKTTIIHVEVSKKYLYDFRNIRMEG